MKRIFIDLLFIVLITPCYCWKAIEPETRRVYQFVAETAPPTPVQRVNLNVTKDEKRILHLLYLFCSSNGVFLVDLTWAPPHRWNGVNEEGRFYSLLCQYEDVKTNESTPFLEIEIPWDVSRLRESFSFPPGELALICALRPTNDIKLNGRWTYSQSVKIDNTEASEQEATATTESTFKIKTNLKVMEEVYKESSNNTAEEKSANVLLDKKEMSLAELLSAIHESTLIEEPFDQDEFDIEKAAPILVTLNPRENLPPFTSNGKAATFKDDLRPKTPNFTPPESNLSSDRKKDDNICSGETCSEAKKFEKMSETLPTIDVKREESSNITDNSEMRPNSALTTVLPLQSSQDTNRLLIFESQTSDPSVEFDVIEPSRSPDDKVIGPAEEDEITETSETDVDVMDNNVTIIEDLDEETQKKIKEDYDNIEAQLREALEVDGLKTPRRLAMSSLGFGIHDRLL